MNGKALARFTVKYVADASGCWLWGGLCDPDGYPLFWLGRRTRPARRVSYEHHVGLIPDGLHVKLTCAVRVCVNPDHLELAADRCTANAAKTHCGRGHEFSPENTYRCRTERRCRTCHNAVSAARVARLRRAKSETR